jgi:fructose-bisphosphate aldolase, class II
LCRFLVFHGGSGSTKDEIKTAVSNGVVKMNVDTGKIFIPVSGFIVTNTCIDTQFAYLAGIRVSDLLINYFTCPILNSLQDFVQNKSGYLQTQVGNPEGADKPNKKVSIDLIFL